MKLSYPTMMATLCLAENFSVGRAFTPTGYSTSSCSASQHTSAYTSLASVLTKDFFQGCTDDSEYSLLYSTSVPSDTDWPLFCSSTNCQALVDFILTLSPPDCILTVPTSGMEINVFAFVDSFDDHCDAILNPTTAPTPTPAPTSTAESTTDEPTTDEPSTPTVTAAPHLNCGGEEQ